MKFVEGVMSGFFSSKRDFNPEESKNLSQSLLKILSPREKTALLLWAYDSYTSKEISDVLKCSPGTARVYLFKARKKIKSLLEKQNAFLQNI